MQIITRAVGDGALDVEDPLIERLYLSRGLTRSEETDKGLKSLVSPMGLMDIDKAARRVAEAVVAQQKVVAAAPCSTSTLSLAWSWRRSC